MLDGILCFKDAIALLLTNIKVYACLVAMNVIFFALMLFCPIGIYLITGDTSGNGLIIVSAMLALIIFLLMNFPMITVAVNAVKVDEENRAFAISELAQSGISKIQMWMLGAGINFVLFSFYLLIATLTWTFAGLETMVALSAFIAIIEFALSTFLYIYVSETIKLKDFKTAYGSTRGYFSKYPKLIYGFIPLMVIMGLTMCYLVYSFLEAAYNIAAVMNNPNVPVDLQSAVLHGTLAVVFLVLLNTICLTAKGVLVRYIQRYEKERQKYVM